MMHVLVANMGDGNAVVASQATLGELLGQKRGDQRPVHRNTVRNAINRLVRDQWIEVVEIGGKGGALGYRINSRVAWHGRRDLRRYARFTAEVLATEHEQSEPIDDRPPLRSVPTVMRGETPLPTGEGEPPPSQPSLEGLEPVLYRDSAGSLYEHDPQTGVLQQRIDQ
jgi:hypothetical protein